MTSSSAGRPGGPRAGIQGEFRGEGLRVAIVCGRFNEFVTDQLLAGTRESLLEHGVAEESITVAWVPGAFEIPLAAQRFAVSGEVDAVVALGAVIRGETGHYEFVAGQCAAGIQRVQLDTGLPVAFGVLTTESLEQALDRAGGREGNKGVDAAEAVMEMVDLLRQLPKPAS